MAEKACHVFGSTTQVGLTQALAVTPNMLATLTLLAMFASGGAMAADTTVSICAIAANPEQFNDTAVSVRATILPNRHGIGLVDSACPGVLVALGSSASDAPGSPNSKFYDTYWKNFLPGGHAITVTLQGQFVYVAGQWPVRRLDNYQVTEFVVETGSHP